MKNKKKSVVLNHSPFLKHFLFINSSPPNFFPPILNFSGLMAAANKAEGKRSLKEMEDEDDGDEEEDGDQFSGLGFGDHELEKKKKGKKGSTGVSGGGSVTPAVTCQAENCSSDMGSAKRYHRRHKVCEFHAKASFVLVAGIQQRFCQQCSRFHGLSEFDESKRSCRRRLAGHNERRRKSSSEYHGDG